MASMKKKRENVSEKGKTRKKRDLAEILFTQSLMGIFFMMLDEPIYWNDSVDKEEVLDYVFEHQRITRINDAMLGQYRANKEDFLGATPKMFFAHDLKQGREAWRKMFDQSFLHYETTEKRFDGTFMQVLGDYVCLYDSEGRITGHFGMQIDISDRIEAENLLRASEEKYRLITESAADAIWVYNYNLEYFAYISPGVERLLGYTAEEAMQMPLLDFYPENRHEVTISGMKKMVEKFKNNPDENYTNLRTEKLVRKDGSLIWSEISTSYRFNDKGEIEVIAVTRDIEDRKKKEEEIEYLNTHDTLTGLLNRNALNQCIVTENPKKERAQSVILLNIDRFRFINDYLGHSLGDHVLRETAEKITAIVQDKGTCYRYGGDEFAVVLNLTSEEEIKAIAQKIQNEISKQPIIKERSLFVTTSLGINPGDSKDSFSQTMKKAETALYAAKKQRNTFVFYDAQMEHLRTREVILEQDLRKALENKQFELNFQPITNIKQGVTDQVEVLLRWNHPEFGRVSPAEFIPIAERNRVIIPITDWIVEKTCDTLLEWKELGIEGITASINLSAVSFENRGSDLVEHIRKVVEEKKNRTANPKA